MIESSQLIELSLYTIDKENNTFDEPLDTTRLDDETIIDYAITTVNKIYNNKRTLEFNYLPRINNEDIRLDENHTIVNKIKNVLNNINDNNTFKENTQDIAQVLFDKTPSTAKKGDLLTCLFDLRDTYYFVLLKIDENKILNRGIDGLWVLSSGLDVLTKLQKAVYIQIPKINNGYQENYLRWEIRAIDNISNDSYYWNINFLNAHYKNDSKINSERLGTFMKDFIQDIDRPLRKNDLTFLYRNFLRSNNNFSHEEFINSVFGTSEEFEDERADFREKLMNISGDPDSGFDLVFNFHTPTIKKEYGEKGSYVFDGEIKITPKIGSGNQVNDRDILKETIAFGEEEEQGFYQDINGKFVKVYYRIFDYEFK